MRTRSSVQGQQQSNARARSTVNARDGQPQAEAHQRCNRQQQDHSRTKTPLGCKRETREATTIQRLSNAKSIKQEKPRSSKGRATSQGKQVRDKFTRTGQDTHYKNTRPRGRTIGAAQGGGLRTTMKHKRGGHPRKCQRSETHPTGGETGATKYYYEYIYIYIVRAEPCQSLGATNERLEVGNQISRENNRTEFP